LTGGKIWGPFWGEFGWEVAQWAPYVNAHFNKERGDILRCQPGHAQLYSVEGAIEQSHPRPTVRLGGAELPMVPDMLQPWALSHTASDGPPPLRTHCGVPEIAGKMKPRVVGTAIGRESRYVVLHCRGINKCEERNLGRSPWDRVVCALNARDIKPVIVGTPQDYLPKGDLAHDLRLGPLCDTIFYMRKAKVVVGASSGPMHLAQACNAPVVVWSGNAHKDERRYELTWNHFCSPVDFIATTWKPDPKDIIKGVDRALQ
jgi:hypothetical protein